MYDTVDLPLLLVEVVEDQSMRPSSGDESTNCRNRNRFIQRNKYLRDSTTFNNFDFVKHDSKNKASTLG